MMTPAPTARDDADRYVDACEMLRRIRARLDDAAAEDVETTLRRITYVRGGRRVEQEHTFSHEPMESEEGVQCSVCRMVTNGDLYCVPWPCAFVERETLSDNLNRVQRHLQHAVSRPEAPDDQR